MKGVQRRSFYVRRSNPGCRFCPFSVESGRDSLKIEEPLIAGVAIGHVDLQQSPFLLRDLVQVVQDAESLELAMELKIHRGDRVLELL